jgi:AcrR family transcriptional regulator
MTLTVQTALPGRSRSSRHPSSLEPHFGPQLGKILDHATEVFCQKGYEGASMRDLSRATGMSLAGMYHYFGSKERLLYLIQKHTFSTIVNRLRGRLAESDDPESGIHIFIENHLEYFLEHQQAMKVLAHEDEVLNGDYGKEVSELKREYYRTCRELLDRYKQKKGLEFDSRTAALALFGMMNWIYTWYNPRLDGNRDKLAGDMGDLFFHGISLGKKNRINR